MNRLQRIDGLLLRGCDGKLKICCPGESSSSISSSSIETPGLPCGHCADAVAPAVVFLTVPEVDYVDWWDGSSPTLTLPGGKHELTQDPDYPCCYKIKITDSPLQETWLTASINAGSVAASWSSVTCSGGTVFWRVFWYQEIDTLHCMNLHVEMPSNNPYPLNTLHPYQFRFEPYEAGSWPPNHTDIPPATLES